MVTTGPTLGVERCHISTICVFLMFTHRFPKAEHLCLRNDIDNLFAAGTKAQTAYPLRVVYREVKHSEGPKVKVLLSVPKRKLRHAVDRNRAKRQLREAYRLNKQIVLASEDMRHLQVALIYSSKEMLDYKTIENATKRILEKICK